MKKEKEIALLTVLVSYANLSRDFDTGLTVLGKRLIDRVAKKGNKIQKKIVLKPNEVKLTSKYFELMKEVDETYFENKDFSAFIMCLLLLSYFVNELEHKELKKEFMDIDLISYISEIEISKLRSETMNHHKAVTKLIEVEIMFNNGE